MQPSEVASEHKTADFHVTQLWGFLMIYTFAVIPNFYLFRTLINKKSRSIKFLLN